ncbi:hypothetical protein [Pseudoalteromonas piscicida]|uniref:hypothetical protein n=1 Tax=Pseudoalteromonas piscicida TaxID=43662 RepID=UPI003C7CA59C
MKKGWKGALASVALLACSTLSYAGNGKAVVPHWLASTNGSTSVFISNITDNPLRVTIKFYDQNGNVKKAERYENFSNSGTEIQANSSAYVNIGQSGVTGYGYATIEWENIGDADDVFGLVAYAHFAKTTLYRSAIPINDGNPF